MRFAVLQFPASNCDQDCVHAARVMGLDADLVWHHERSLGPADAVIIPGGFSYGDYLRCGAVARFSPVMAAVQEFARQGGLVLGICNGFQILCEAGLLPGALIRNRDLRFHCEWVQLRADHCATPFTSAGPANRPLRLPIAHGEGCYFADETTLAALESSGRILWRYCAADGSMADATNPNGSLLHIAGVMNEGGNVAGLMPHPDRAVENLTGGEDGKWIFQSMIDHLSKRLVGTS